MKRSVWIFPVKVPAICTLILAACTLAVGQNRGGMPLGDARMYIGGVLSRAHVSGSLEYWGVCNFKELYPDFPKFRAVPSHEGSPVELLRDMFSVDPEMRVSQDADGKVRMIEEDIPHDLLNMKIHHLHFPAEYHGPDMAINVIMRNPDVIAFRMQHDIGPETDWSSSFGFPSDALVVSKPSVAGDLYDVTVEQALDYVLETFPGFWVYENCQNPRGGRTVYVGFFENVSSAVPVQVPQ